MPTRNHRSKTTTVDLPVRPTESVIRTHCGKTNFDRGYPYFESGQVFHARRTGTALKARCHGQSYDHYDISIDFGADGRINADCTCPVGSGGACKHVAAALLTWLHSTESFVEQAPLSERLAHHDREELIGLIEEMLTREPDLEEWIELALPTLGTPDVVVSSEDYRARATLAFEDAGYEWDAAGGIAGELEALRSIGDRFRAKDRFVNAAAVYVGIVDAVIEGYATTHDENGDVLCECRDATESLCDCLPHLESDRSARAEAIRSLFDLLRFDIEFGGVGLSDPVPDILLKHGSPEERVTISEWIQAASETSEPDTRGWRAKQWGSLLLDFQGEPESDEEFLAHCREFGLTRDAIRLLLERGRLEEALALTQAESDYDLCGHADLLVEYGHTDFAEELIRERHANKQGRRNRSLVEWLKEFYRSGERWSDLLGVCVEVMRDQPSFAAYREARGHACALGMWDGLQAELTALFPPQSDDLIRVFLEEEDFDEAVRLLTSRSKKSGRLGMSWDRIELDVAEAVEESHPQTAIAIYKTEAEALIDQRGRSNYATACVFLEKVRRLSAAKNQTAEWDEYLADLRETHRSLRAFKDELMQHGLCRA